MERTGGICVVAGEASGDVQAAPMIAALKRRLAEVGFGEVAVWGAAGPSLRALGVEPIVRTEDLAVMAFSEIVPSYFRIRNAFNRLLEAIEERKPLAVVLVDYPGFNMRLAEACFQRGVTVLYHIAPKVWAHGWNRVVALREHAHCVTCILPFEETLFRRAGVPARFIGNPLCDAVRAARTSGAWERPLLPDDPLAIGLLPGSRRSEIERVLPLLVQSLSELERRLGRPVRALLPVAPTLSDPFVRSVILRAAREVQRSDEWVDTRFELIPSGLHKVMSTVRYAWVCSGTATLEAALHFVPMAVVYRMSLLSALISKSILRIPYVSLVNLCAHREVVPEFLQFRATVENLVGHAQTILTDSAARNAMLEELHRIDAMFPENGAATAANVMTDAILRYGLPAEQKFRLHRYEVERALHLAEDSKEREL